MSINSYIPCSEAQRTKIEALRNAIRLKQWKLRVNAKFDALINTPEFSHIKDAVEKHKKQRTQCPVFRIED